MATTIDGRVLSIEGDHALLEGRTPNLDIATLLPGQRREIGFDGTTGLVVIMASALDPHAQSDDDGDPSQDHEIGHGADGHGHAVHQKPNLTLFVDALVEVLDSAAPGPDGGPSVVASFPIKKGSHPGVIGPHLQFHFVLGGPATTRPLTCRITNRSTIVARAFLQLSYVAARLPVRSTKVPVATLNHAYRLVLAALTPKVHIDGQEIVVEFGQELHDFLHGNVPQLAPIDTGGLTGSGALTSFSLHAVSGADLLAAVEARYESRVRTYEQQLATVQNDPTAKAVVQRHLVELDAWRHSYDAIGSGWPVIRGDVNFTDIVYGYDSWWTPGTITLADVRDVTAAFFVAFDPTTVATIAFADSALIIDADVEGLVELAHQLGIIPDLLDGILEPRIRDLLATNGSEISELLGRYVAVALGRLCHPNAIYLGVTADATNWTVTFAALADAAATHGDTGVIGGSTGTTTSSGDQTGVLMTFHPPSSSAAPTPSPVAAPAGGFGVVPPEFTVIAPETVARLDNIDTIVVVMMENRSFDHLLGHLRQRRAGAGYEGFTGHEVNEIAGVTPGVSMLPATQANIPGPVTAIPKSPEHGIDHVIPQIDGGRMSGFAQDYEERYPGDGIGQWVMTFYTENELPTYYGLADRFTVCDHWFASHPGDTWPNRWTTLSGHTPFLQNPPVDEPTIGFMPQPTVFDLLDRRGIDWRVFESDLSLLRTFARYRLDATHLVPYIDPDDSSRSFETIARAGQLPPVVFVEPDFSDVPPLSTAYDDLAPVDLAKGQRFVAQVFDALRSSPKWASTLMLVVYDEHGGFYDHVAPPGTPLGPPEYIGKVARIHPDGADHLGVRVPAILASPWVAPGGVCHQVFDHTTIIKTILLRHRASFATEDFTLLGPRVNQAAHLGVALSPHANPDDHAQPFAAPSPSGPQPRLVTPQVPDRGTRDPTGSTPFGESLYRSFLPHQT